MLLRKQPIVELDGLRVLAHSLIFMLHSFQAAGVWVDQTTDLASSFRASFLYKASTIGFGAVDLFMIISGLLTVRWILQYQHHTGATPSILSGVFKRWMRFVPGVLCAVCLHYLLRVGSWNPLEPLLIGTGIFPWLLHVYWRHASLALGPLWSFSTDFQATALLLILAALCQRVVPRNRFQHHFSRLLFLVLVCSIGARAAVWAEPNRTLRFMSSLPPLPSFREKIALENHFNVSIPIVGLSNDLTLRVIDWFQLSYTNVFIRMTSFAGGGLIASKLHSLSLIPGEANRQNVHHISHLTGVALMCVCSIIISLPLFPLGVDSVLQTQSMSAWDDFLAIVLVGTLTPLAWLGLCAGAVLPIHHPLSLPWIKKAYTLPIFRVLGRFTYLSYAIHFILIFYFSCAVIKPAASGSVNLQAHAVELMALCMGLSLIISATLHYTVEKPFQFLVQKFVKWTKIKS